MTAQSAHCLVDIHHHILPSIYMETLGERLGTQGLFGSASWDASRSLESMDRNGIAAAITSISGPGFWFGNPAETQNLVRACNDFAAVLRDDHPSRFGMFASLPLPDIRASLREFEYASNTLSTDGFILFANYNGTY